jgi:transposase
VSPEKTIYFEINEGTNNNESFLSFFKHLINVISKKELGQFFFVMDNCTIHLTKKLQDFYKKNKLKIMIIVPYYSELNSVELCFRYIKKKIVNKLYKRMNRVELEVT